MSEAQGSTAQGARALRRRMDTKLDDVLMRLVSLELRAAPRDEKFGLQFDKVGADGNEVTGSFDSAREQ